MINIGVSANILNHLKKREQDYNGKYYINE